MAKTWRTRLRNVLSGQNKVRFSDLYIQTKEETLIPFVPNAVQQNYLDGIAPGWRASAAATNIINTKEVILKARQFGFSTLIAALFFLKTVNTPNTNTVIVADKADNSEELFQKVKLMWEMLPEEKRPTTKYNNRRQLYFPALRSRFTVLTAGKKGAGRSRTIQNLHCSEAAFYENKKLLTGLLQAVPKDGNVFIESTANGEQGDGEVYCSEYKRAKSGESGYNARFFAWYHGADYETDVPKGFVRTEEEAALVLRADLDRTFGAERTNRKLAWRRLKKAEPGMGSLFAQEFPSDDKEAFLVSGSRYFTEWDEDRHTVLLSELETGFHLSPFGGFDWGYGVPSSFGLYTSDTRGRVVKRGEWYQARVLDGDQAAAVVAVIEAHGFRKQDVPIYADPSMWAKKTDNKGRVFQNVQAFHDAGLWMIPASNERVAGWSNVRQYLADDCPPTEEETAQGIGPTPMFRVAKGCANTIRTFPMAIHDAVNVEDLEDDNDAETHALDETRYALSSRPAPAREPKAKNKHAPSWMRKKTSEKL